MLDHCLRCGKPTIGRTDFCDEHNIMNERKVQVHKLYSREDVKALIMAAKRAQFTSASDFMFAHCAPGNPVVDRCQMLADLCMDLANCLQAEVLNAK